MIFNVTIDRDEDGVFVVECPSIPGCVSQGKTKEEALENISDAIKLCLQVRSEKGLPLITGNEAIRQRPLSALSQSSEACPFQSALEDKV